MILYSANPSNPPAKKRGGKRKPAAHKAAHAKGETMAKKRKWGSPAQRAALRKMLAARKRTTHKNPSSPAKKRHYGVSSYRKRRVVRNPSLLGGGSIFKELVSVEGAMMIGAALAAPMVADYAQEKLMPTATGWVKIGVKAAVVGAGAFAIHKFLKKKNVALAFGVTGLAVLVNDAIKIAQGQLSGLSADEADYAAQIPGNASQLVMAGYERGLSDAGQGGGYQMGLSGADDAFVNAFPPAFGGD